MVWKMRWSRLAPLAAAGLLGCASAPSGGGPGYGSPGAQPSVSTERANADGDGEKSGKRLYATHCAACHQDNGAGVPRAFPPLVGTDFVLGDKSRLIRVVLFGLEGPLEIEGETYDGQMPAHAALMSDAEIARVLTYVRSSWNNQADKVTQEEVSEQRLARGGTPPE